MEGHELLLDSLEQRDRRRIELHATVGPEASGGFPCWQRRPIGTRRRHRVIAVGDRHQPRMRMNIVLRPRVFLDT